MWQTQFQFSQFWLRCLRRIQHANYLRQPSAPTLIERYNTLFKPIFVKNIEHFKPDSKHVNGIEQ